MATDPKLALKKARDLWDHLSGDEPENQARPTSFEQLIVMLTRESARRIVHLINFTKSTVVKLPNTLSVGVHMTSAQLTKVLDNLIKVHEIESKKKHVVSLLSQAFKIHLIVIGIFQIQDNNNINHS